MAVKGTDTPQLWLVLIIARADEFTRSRWFDVTAMVTRPSWLSGCTVGDTRVTLPSSSPAPITLIRAVWLTFSFGRSRVGTRPIRSNSDLAMMLNNASPRPDAVAPITAEELAISPVTGD